MSRLGRPHLPFYRINAVDSRVKRDGSVLENLGWYDPCTKDAKQHELNVERIKYWLAKGAQPSETVMDLLARENIVDGTEWKKRHAWRIEAKKKGAEKRALLAADKKDDKK